MEGYVGGEIVLIGQGLGKVSHIAQQLRPADLLADIYVLMEVGLPLQCPSARTKQQNFYQRIEQDCYLLIFNALKSCSKS